MRTMNTAKINKTAAKISRHFEKLIKADKTFKCARMENTGPWGDELIITIDGHDFCVSVSVDA